MDVPQRLALEQRVRIRDLKSRAELNGCLGTVVAHTAENDRWAVKLSVAKLYMMPQRFVSMLSLKASNLEPVDVGREEEGLCALPADALARVLLALTSDAVSLSFAAAACHQLRASAREAALERAPSLGYDLEAMAGMFDGYPNPIHALHEARRDLPVAVPATAATAMRVLREDLEQFKPVLATPRRLVMPDAGSFLLGDTSGVAEYANLIALYRGAEPSLAAARAPLSTADVQRWVEAAWREGLDGGNSAYFGGRIVGEHRAE